MKTLKIYYLVMLSSIMILSVGCSKEETGMEEINSVDAHYETKDIPNNGAKAKMYTVNFGELNSSGVAGTAELTLDGVNLTVKISASGLEPGAHAQHIHGFTANEGNAKCPPASADVDGDGLITVGEGAPFYGGILLTLQPFPEADEDGNLEFEMTYENVTKDITPLQNKAIVLHGMDGMPSLPVACGQIKASQGSK
ncbi:superoxide dismutase family protein [Gramella sp. MT6]|uniref:hypothetical protein n=1 Tax=Gramella sp. MT6 TaxID=2705471 RepID=UPI001C5F087E|nr:hypothetical protein [Gramella sp. MT6]QYA25571.1 superoxide dismutase family protein [Gramella sp. MT6]